MSQSPLGPGENASPLWPACVSDPFLRPLGVDLYGIPVPQVPSGSSQAAQLFTVSAH